MKKFKINSTDVFGVLSFLYANSLESPLRSSLNKLSIATATSKYAVGGILLYLSRTNIVQINRISYRDFELQWSISKSCPTEAMADSLFNNLSKLSREFKFNASGLFPRPAVKTQTCAEDATACSASSMPLNVPSDIVDLSKVKASFLVQELRRRGFIVSAKLEL